MAFKDELYTKTEQFSYVKAIKGPSCVMCSKYPPNAISYFEPKEKSGLPFWKGSRIWYFACRECLTKMGGMRITERVVNELLSQNN